MAKSKAIEQYMTRDVQTVGSEQPMSIAYRIMQEHGIGHLPVVQRGKLVGIVSDRDLSLRGRADAHPVKVAVADVMSRAPYVVAPQASVDEVVAAMTRDRHRAAVVIDAGRVVGIFTSTDACQVLSRILSVPPSEEQNPSG